VGSNPTPSAMARDVTVDEPTADPITPAAAMALALDEARAALVHDDVPVGAVVVHAGRVVAARHNERELTADPSAHAEILAMRDASVALGQWRLDECTMYVTLEPCAMCAGALVNSRIERLVYGAADPKAGYCGTLGNLVQDPRLNHRLAVTAGVLEEESAALLRGFFASLRTLRARPPGGKVL
jgi:tRNA(adenine34) deaminase